jgi:hypothetical protein
MAKARATAAEGVDEDAVASTDASFARKFVIGQRARADHNKISRNTHSGVADQGAHPPVRAL